jgi:hypothetical protein
MQVRQARDYVVHRPALRASLPGTPEPSPGPHLLVVAELRAPLPADPARTPGKSARCRLRLADPRSAGTDGLDLATADDPRSWRYDRMTAPRVPAARTGDRRQQGHYRRSRRPPRRTGRLLQRAAARLPMESGRQDRLGSCQSSCRRPGQATAQRAASGDADLRQRLRPPAHPRQGPRR